jgi:hypothetical protein
MTPTRWQEIERVYLAALAFLSVPVSGQSGDVANNGVLGSVRYLLVA